MRPCGVLESYIGSQIANQLQLCFSSTDCIFKKLRRERCNLSNFVQMIKSISPARTESSIRWSSSRCSFVPLIPASMNSPAGVKSSRWRMYSRNASSCAGIESPSFSCRDVETLNASVNSRSFHNHHPRFFTPMLRNPSASFRILLPQREAPIIFSWYSPPNAPGLVSGVFLFFRGGFIFQ